MATTDLTQSELNQNQITFEEHLQACGLQLEDTPVSPMLL